MDAAFDYHVERAGEAIPWDHHGSEAGTLHEGVIGLHAETAFLITGSVRSLVTSQAMSLKDRIDLLFEADFPCTSAATREYRQHRYQQAKIVSYPHCSPFLK
jgi:hypothetical protein